MPTFTPPSIDGPRDTTTRFFRRIRNPMGVTVLRIGGLYQQIPTPGDLDFAHATEAYLGGHTYIIDQATADALTSAGYGAFIT